MAHLRGCQSRYGGRRRGGASACAAIFPLCVGIPLVGLWHWLRGVGVWPTLVTLCLGTFLHGLGLLDRNWIGEGEEMLLWGSEDGGLDLAEGEP